MNKLIKAVVLSFILIGIAVYIVVSSMPGRDPEEKVLIAGSRAAKTAGELDQAISDRRISDVPSIVKAIYQPPAPDELKPGSSSLGDASKERTGPATAQGPGREDLSPAREGGDGGQVSAAMQAPAASKKEEAAKPGPTEHKVRPGETLSMIARQYLGDANKWRAIRDANPGLNPDLLKVGQVIRIPPAGDATSVQGEPRKSSDAPEPRKPRKDHMVAQGDTLYSIARRYSVTVDEIRGANPGLDEHNLAVGLRLCIPGS